MAFGSFERTGPSSLRSCLEDMLRGSCDASGPPTATAARGCCLPLLGSLYPHAPIKSGCVVLFLLHDVAGHNCIAGMGSDGTLRGVTCMPKQVEWSFSVCTSSASVGLKYAG